MPASRRPRLRPNPFANANANANAKGNLAFPLNQPVPVAPITRVAVALAEQFDQVPTK